MKTKSKILRSLLAGLMVLLRRSRLADLNLTLIGFGLLSVFLWTGCVGVVPVPSNRQTYGKVITREQIKFIVLGQTTRAEVTEKLGDQFRESPRLPALAYSWEKPAADLVWLIASTENVACGHIERSHWRAFFVEFDSGGQVRRTEFMRLSGQKSLDEQLEDWAQRHGAASTISNITRDSK